MAKKTKKDVLLLELQLRGYKPKFCPATQVTDAEIEISVNINPPAFVKCHPYRPKTLGIQLSKGGLLTVNEYEYENGELVSLLTRAQTHDPYIALEAVIHIAGD